jgi:hypothetical protein
MSSNLVRFYYCQSDISLQDFLKREIKSQRGIAFEDVYKKEADAFEQRLKEENEDYIRIDL